MSRVNGRTLDATRNLESAAITSRSVPFTEPFGSLLDADKDRLSRLQSLFRHGPEFGIWLTPKEWLPANHRLRYRKQADLKARIVESLRKQGEAALATSPLVETAVVSAIRYLLLLRCGPSGLGYKAKNRSLDATSISKLAHREVPELFARGIVAASKLPSPSADHLISGIDLSALRDIKTHSPKTMLIELKRMRMLRNMGFWRDVADEERPKLSELMTAEEPEANPRVDTDPHLPLPDEYAALMASRSLWLSENLCDNVIEIVADLSRELDAFIRRRGRAMSKATFARRAVKRLAAHVWRDSIGQTISAVPFPLAMPKEVHVRKRHRLKLGDETEHEPCQWPPRGARELHHLIAIIQTAHYFTVALSIGARASEALSLTRDCLRRSADGSPLITGLTFKLVERFEGEERDWDVPDAAVIAVERQARLIVVTDRFHSAQANAKPSTELEAGDNLWGQIGVQSRDASGSLVNINRKLREFAQALRMDVSPGGQNIRSHRFRKTLARLVALALTQAPKLLMEIFGHKSIHMTLHYILSDSSLRAEIETVTRELKVMRGKELIEDIVAAEQAPDEPRTAGYGGFAAVTVVSAVSAHRQRLHRNGKAWGVESAYELSELLTMKGDAWEYVRSGVICTKLPGEVGACNRKRGRPEAGNCKVTCDHRLEEKFMRNDVDGAIADCVAHLERARAEDDSMLESYWAGQVRTHVPRFPDVKAKWMSNTVVSELFGEAA